MGKIHAKWGWATHVRVSSFAGAHIRYALPKKFMRYLKDMLYKKPFLLFRTPPVYGGIKGGVLRSDKCTPVQLTFYQAEEILIPQSHKSAS